MATLLDVVYLALIAVLSPYLAWSAWRKGKYREGYAEKLFGFVPRRDGDRPCVWFHAVSVGEVNLLPGLVARWRERHPDWEVVVSTTTKTGMELARRRFSDCTVFYCPLDFSWAVRRALRRIRPRLLVLAELEIWPNLIRTAKRHGVRVAVVNGRLGEKSFRGYSRLRFFLRHVFGALDLAAAQDGASAQRFVAMGTPSWAVRVTGSMKYDGAETCRENPKTVALRRLAGIDEDDIVFLAGSTQEGEEAIVLDVFARLASHFPKLRLILVPRHPERFDAVAERIAATPYSWIRRSALKDGTPEHWRIMLVDTIGELGAWWGTARLAFVGGSLGNRGGQNMIEPAAYGAAVCYGPNTWNFRDITAHMAEAKAAVVVDGADSLERFLVRCLEEPEYAAELGRRAKELVAKHRGAVDRTLALLELLPDASQPPERRLPSQTSSMNVALPANGKLRRPA
ncbi:MAG: 3-deoxy-D-manno-octulosonic acid transferase [Planctomycetota bacterium]|nr:MAG: 3-deoxy-D-manno-octulosonic acid transferase [Planctomycetota bacterium]